MRDQFQTALGFGMHWNTEVFESQNNNSFYLQSVVTFQSGHVMLLV